MKLHRVFFVYTYPTMENPHSLCTSFVARVTPPRYACADAADGHRHGNGFDTPHRRHHITAHFHNSHCPVDQGLVPGFPSPYTRRLNGKAEFDILFLILQFGPKCLYSLAAEMSKSSPRDDRRASPSFSPDFGSPSSSVPWHRVSSPYVPQNLAPPSPGIPAPNRRAPSSPGAASSLISLAGGTSSSPKRLRGSPRIL